jgi:hypothetical protein
VSQYLLSTYATEGRIAGGPETQEEMRAFMDRVAALEAEMDGQGAFVFGGALHGPDAASVFRPTADRNVMTTDGPFLESKEQIGGFYIIDAPDDDAAAEWARKVALATNHAIEFRAFRAMGRLQR